MDFQIGDVVNRTFGSISRNFVTFFLLSMLLVGAPTLIVGLAQFSIFNEGSAIIILSVVAGIVSFATTYILQGALIHGAVVDFNGGRADFGACLSTGLRHAVSIFVIALLMGLGVGLGLVLLIVPGIILSIMWIVAIPARVVENTGIGESFTRSRELTENNRWKIFGLLVIYIIISTVISLIVMLPAGVLGYSAGQSGETFGVGAPTIGVVVLNVLVTVLTAVVSATGVSAIYYELRKSKEGVGAEEIAKVFE